MTPEINRLDTRIAVINVLRNALDEIFISLNEHRKNLVSEQLAATADNLTPQSFMAFREWDHINADLWKRFRNWFESNYHHKGLVSHGYYETHQAALELCFDQNKPFEEQRGLLDFWDHLVPTRDHGIPKIRVGVFEHSLSERTCYHVTSDPQKTKIILGTSYGREIFASRDLNAVMKYVYDHHPYKKRGRK